MISHKSKIINSLNTFLKYIQSNRYSRRVILFFTNGFKRITLTYFVLNKYKYFFKWSVKNNGLLSTYPIYCKLMLKSIFVKQNTLNNKIPNLKQSVLLRPIEADLHTFNEIFRDQFYNIDYSEVKYIIDAGGHIGLAAVYFALQYPDAKILSMEPEDSNYNILLKNTICFPNIIPVKAALWSHKTFVSIVNPEESPWGFKVSDNDRKDKILALNIQDALELLDTDYIDILKINIEGSEIEVFEASEKWIEKVKYIIIELHDRLRTGCSDSFHDAIKDTDFVKIATPGFFVIYKNRKFK